MVETKRMQKLKEFFLLSIFTNFLNIFLTMLNSILKLFRNYLLPNLIFHKKKNNFAKNTFFLILIFGYVLNAKSIFSLSIWKGPKTIIFDCIKCKGWLKKTVNWGDIDSRSEIDRLMSCIIGFVDNFSLSLKLV